MTLRNVPFLEIADLNPSLSSRRSELGPDVEVSFLAMTDVSESGEWTTRQTRRYGEVSSGYTAFEENDVLFAKITPCMENGKGAHARNLVNGLGFGSTEFHVLRARRGTEPRFVYHWTQSWLLRRAAEAAMTGSAGQQRVGSGFFRRFTIPLFAQEEQRRIVDILDVLDEAIRKTEQVVAKLKQIKQGLLEHLLACGVDQNGELRDRAGQPNLFRPSPLGPLPKTWEIVETSSLCSLITKGTTPTSAEMWQGGEGVPFLRVDNLSFDGDLDLVASQFRISQRTHAGVLSRSRTVPGDVLTNIVGPPLGKVGLISEDVGEVNINQAIAVFRPNPALRSRFLLLWLLGQAAQQWLRRHAKQTSGQLNLTLQMCRELPIPRVPVEEQDRVVSRMDAIQARLSSESALVLKLNLMRRGIAGDLLTGKVRTCVPTCSFAPEGRNAVNA
jgi:type I restriction enzyme S subunit